MKTTLHKDFTTMTDNNFSITRRDDENDEQWVQRVDEWTDNLEVQNFGLSPRSDSAWSWQQLRETNPEEYDALIQADLDVMKQPIFDSPYDKYDSIDEIETDYPTAHSQLLANLSGDDINPHDIWALAEGDYTALERLPEDKRDIAFRICDRMEESGNWRPIVIPDWDSLSGEFQNTIGVWDETDLLQEVPELGYAEIEFPLF
jgi:hypothetical protein